MTKAQNIGERFHIPLGKCETFLEKDIRDKFINNNNILVLEQDVVLLLVISHH